MEKHKVYEVNFKLNAVVIARKKSIAAAAREFGMDQKQIYHGYIHDILEQHC